MALAVSVEGVEIPQVVPNGELLETACIRRKIDPFVFELRSWSSNLAKSSED